MEDAAAIIIQIMKDQGRICDDCGDPEIQVVSTPWQLDDDGAEDDHMAPGEYVQKCYCGPCFIKRLEQNEPKRHTEMSIQEWIEEVAEGAMLADGFDDAIIGVAERCGQPRLVVYDAERCIQILVERDAMEPDDAAEYFSFNTLGAWAGPRSPLFLWRYQE